VTLGAEGSVKGLTIRMREGRLPLERKKKGSMTLAEKVLMLGKLVKEGRV